MYSTTANLTEEKQAVTPPASDSQRVSDDHVEKQHVEYDDLQVKCPDHTTERKLTAKIDLRVVPFLCILYLLAFLDRVNISNAVLYRLRQDLKIISGVKYNTALVIFFVPYILFEIPSNILLKRFRPRVWLSGCMFFFGLVTCLQGLVQSYSGLLAARFWLGVFEAGMFPGCFYLIGMWYTREQAQRRYSFFFSSTTLAGAFGGLLASAIGLLDHHRGYSGWRWIFIIEGAFTAAVAIVFSFVLPEFPERAKWLKEDERQYIRARLAAEQGVTGHDRHITFREVLNVFKDYKVILGGFSYFGLIVPAYGYAYFAPTIIKANFNYTTVRTQLYSVPPWAAAFAFAMIIATCSDKVRHRYLFAIGSICVSLTGFAMLLRLHHSRHAEYAALFLVTMGTYTAMPIVVCWFNMNLGGHHRRAVGSAYQVGFGNVGGIIAVYSFLQSDAKHYYEKGYKICLAFVCLSAASCTLYAIACWHQNKAKDALPAEEREGKNLTEEERMNLGDLAPNYRYQL